MRRLCKENLIDFHMLNDDRVLVYSRKINIKLKLPGYIGFSVLEKSRRIMKYYFYGILLHILAVNSLSLIYSDTDSFILKYFLYLDEYSEQKYFDEKI